MERFELISDQLSWNKCFADKFAACYYIDPRRASMKTMALFRLASFFIAAALIVAAIYEASNRNDFMLYYTHWSLLALMIMCFSGSLTSIFIMQQTYGNIIYIPKHAVVFRTLYNIACTANIVSTIGYFVITFTYPNATKKVINHVIYSANTLLVLMEVIVNAVPMRLFHVYQPLLYTLAYATFAYLYHHYTGRAIYKCLEWEDQRELTKLTIGFIILMFVVYMFLYVISFIKNKMLKL
uniref:Uncharacterized protein n=1 Tax=Spodoptera frugiperda nuclear polyhedrosis virus TaxID=10455 RepID=I0B9E1_NPVSF|nr:hypothetical protein Sf38 [Spodoptera frugiperda multiple nucleopolyhedrovirus]